MLALGLDTSRATGSIGLHDDAGRFAPHEVPAPPVHSRRLLDVLRRALEDAGAGVRDIDVVAVACGPGSFTGLRVGMATARGLSLALGCPVVGFSTLETMALAAAASLPGEPRVTALMDAGRGQVYRGAYRIASGAAFPLRPEAAIAVEQARQEPGADRVVFAAGLESSGALGEFLRECGAIPAPPLGGMLARRAIALCRSAAGGPLPPLIPNYLRASDAESTTP